MRCLTEAPAMDGRRGHNFQDAKYKRSTPFPNFAHRSLHQKKVRQRHDKPASAAQRIPQGGVVSGKLLPRTWAAIASYSSGVSAFHNGWFWRSHRRSQALRSSPTGLAFPSAIKAIARSYL